MENVKKLERIATQVRRDIVRMVTEAASGHPGGSMSAADFMVALYFEVMNHDPARFTLEGKDQDVFYLSNGHVSPVWYSVLARSGYFDAAELASFRKLGTRLQGHPCVQCGLPGIRIASGSLGQGLSCAIGHALAKRMDGDPNLVYVMMGDGECQEGQIWEAAMFASSAKVDNIIAIVDWNRQQIDGSVDEVLSLGDFPGKWTAFGWQVLEMDGHNMQQIIETLHRAKSLSGKGKPVVILMTSRMGMGVDFMCDTNEWHGKAPDKKLAAEALLQLEMTLEDY